MYKFGADIMAMFLELVEKCYYKERSDLFASTCAVGLSACGHAQAGAAGRCYCTEFISKYQGQVY